MSFGGSSPEMVESTTQGSKLRPRTQKNPRPRPSTALPRTDPVEAKDQRHNVEVISKKKVFAPKFCKLSGKFTCSPKRKKDLWKFQRSPENKMSSKFFSQALPRTSPRRNKIGYDLWPIFN